ncbi:MAG: hypothetical protein R6U04_05640 [Bacteroidales bacterium]
MGEVSPEGIAVGHISGFVGDCEDEVNESYYDKETNGQNDDEGKEIPKTILEMQQKCTYENWDFDEI